MTLSTIIIFPLYINSTCRYNYDIKVEFVRDFYLPGPRGGSSSLRPQWSSKPYLHVEGLNIRRGMQRIKSNELPNIYKMLQNFDFGHTFKKSCQNAENCVVEFKNQNIFLASPLSTVPSGLWFYFSTAFFRECLYESELAWVPELARFPETILSRVYMRLFVAG